MDNNELIDALHYEASTYGNKRTTANAAILLDRAALALAAQDARIAELEAKLISEREDVLWNAYSTGSAKNGRWTHMFMSDGESLVQQCGLDPTLGDYDAQAIMDAIPEAAKLVLTEK